MSAVLDGITVIIVMTSFGIASIFGYMVLDEVNTDMVISNDTVAAQEVVGDLHGKFPTLLDNLFLFAFILLGIFVLVSVFLIDTHPIFFILSILLLVGVFIVGGIMANALDDIMSDPSISEYANQFPYTGWIMTHLVELIIALTFLVTIALFAKYRLT